MNVVMSKGIASFEVLVEGSEFSLTSCAFLAKTPFEVINKII